MSTHDADSPASLPPRGALRRRVLAGEPTVGLWMMLDALLATDQLARAGFDWLVVDLEHGTATEASLYAQLLAIQGTPTTAITRVQSAERLRVCRALDLGTDGVVIPQVGSAVEAAQLVRWMRYPPEGVRGLALATRGAGLGSRTHAEVAAQVNDQILGVFQVESPAAVADAEAMAALDGVDVLFVGPADLSHAMGIPGRLDEPAFLAALDAVVAACRAHGKAAGILLQSAAAVPAYRDRGFTFIGIGSDIGLLASGAKAQLAEARTILAR